MAYFEQAKYAVKICCIRVAWKRFGRQALLQAPSTEKGQFAANSRVETNDLDT